MQDLLAIDTEHGGFDDENNPLDLLEFAGVIFNTQWKIKHHICMKVIPDNGIVRVTGEALGVNKIDLCEHAKEAIPYKEAKKMLGEWLHKQCLQTGAR